ncbi:MAG: radical SAM protein, partial [Peptococcaceae bacterium]|nr:radical SAM protein [Peptococcaceae bacterium]
GLTVSGGEPLFQGEFLLTLLRESRRRKIRTAMETSGFGEYETLKRAAALLDTVLYDIKSLDDEAHTAWTGQSNALILENFQRLCADFPSLPKVVRTPVIPGFNDSAAAVRQIRSFLEGKPGVSFETLSYHRFGVGKYEALGRPYTVAEKLPEA